MRRCASLPFRSRVALVVAIVAALWIAIPQRVPSRADCVDLWNRPSNARVQRAVIGYPKVSIDGWDSKAGAHCSALFFDREGEPWQMYVLWLANPEGLPAAYGADIGGDRFGSGWFFEVQRWYRSNATIARDGRFSID